MDPFVTGSLIQLGGGMLGGLLDDTGKRRKEALRGIGQSDARLGGMMGQMPYDPYQVAALGRRSIAADTQAIGNRMDKMYNMDIGSGAGGLWGGMLGQQQALLGQNMVGAGMAKFGRDADLERMRAQLAMARLGSV